jgi:hypothetical protein
MSRGYEGRPVERSGLPEVLVTGHNVSIPVMNLLDAQLGPMVKDWLAMICVECSRV